MTYHLKIDTSLCQGHGRCEALAPELFEFDDLGFAHPVVQTVAGELIELARTAKANCPEQAISVSAGVDVSGD